MPRTIFLFAGIAAASAFSCSATRTALRVRPNFMARHSAGACATNAVTPQEKQQLELEPPEDPSRRRLVSFALPATVLWLAGPLLSLIDTSAVGLTAPPGAGASQLAALGPATTFCDGSIYLFAFVNVATTNLYASSLARDDGTADAVVRRAVKVALVCATVLVPITLAFGRSLLGLYVGGAASTNAALMDPALRYISIRCLSFPASLIGGVLQCAFLAAEDSIAPVISVAWATAANVVLDLVCVAGLGLGLSGAAFATFVAQWLGTLVLVRKALRSKLAGDAGFQIAPRWLRRGTGASGGESTHAVVPTKSFLAFAAPVLTLILGKIAAYGFLTHSAAGLGALALATHQIGLSLFFFLTSSFLEVFGQTAQTFLPAYGSPPPGADATAWRRASDRLAWRLTRFATITSFASACIAAAIPLFATSLLTNDATVRLAVRPLAVPLAVAAFMSGPIAAAEGILLARRSLGFLASVYVSTIALLPPVLLAVERRGGPVVRLWTCFAIFQVIRSALFTARIWLPRLLGTSSSAQEVSRVEDVKEGAEQD